MPSNAIPMSTAPTASLRMCAFGRCLIASLFLISGIQKALNFPETAAWIAAAGVPFPEVVLIGAAALEIGWHAQLWSILLALFVSVASLTFHRFWAVESAAFAIELQQFLKNCAITGAFLIVYWLGTNFAATTSAMTAPLTINQ